MKAPPASPTWTPSSMSTGYRDHASSATRVLLHPGLCLRGESPDFDDVVAPRTRKSFYECGAGSASAGHRQQRTSTSCWCPRHGIASDSVGFEHVHTPLTIICAFDSVRFWREGAVRSGEAGWSIAPLKVRTEILPSEEAQARMAPSSWGVHETELTGLPFPSH